MLREINPVRLTRKIGVSGTITHTSNTTIDRDKNQDDRFYPSEKSEIRQP